VDTQSPISDGAAPAPAPPPKPERSTIELVRAIAQDSSTLLRKELELARLEITEAVKARLKGIAALVVAGAMALFALIFLSVMAVVLIDIKLPKWAAWLIVGGTLLVVAGIAALIGRHKLKHPPMKPEETVRTVKEDVEWARAQLKR
jgi:uncharacterized membrane protein YqjE